MEGRSLVIYWCEVCPYLEKRTIWDVEDHWCTLMSTNIVYLNDIHPNCPLPHAPKE